MLSWVVGRGGLLGSSVERSLGRRSEIWKQPMRFAWSDPELARSQIEEACARFSATVGWGPWQVAWCAGAGVVGSSPVILQEETMALCRLLESLKRQLCVGTHGTGVLFLASSAGGVYAGTPISPPFNEESPVAPLAPYGWNKLEQERLASTWSEDSGVPVVIGRISNLYGPAQNLCKAQGLISQVCLRLLTRQPLILYVPLDTIRDYLYADDAGELVARSLERVRADLDEGAGARAVVKVLASHQPTTVGSVLAQSRWITKRPVSVLVGSSPSTRHQARDLRMTSIVWPELDRSPKTALSDGMRSVLTSLLRAMGTGKIGAPSSW